MIHRYIMYLQQLCVVLRAKTIMRRNSLCSIVVSSISHKGMAQCFAPLNGSHNFSGDTSHAITKRVHQLKCVTLLLLLLSGHVQLNPGPSQEITPEYFKGRGGLGFLYLNVRSLLQNWI